MYGFLALAEMTDLLAAHYHSASPLAADAGQLLSVCPTGRWGD
jgi:hypothetical protein